MPAVGSCHTLSCVSGSVVALMVLPDIDERIDAIVLAMSGSIVEV